MGGLHHANNDDDYQGDGLPLNDVTRPLIIVVHYSAIPVVTLAIYALMKNIRIFETRIWSPFLLMTTLTWLLMATAFEISNHFYVDNWQLYDPQADLINGSFSFFNFGAQNLLALSLRKRGISFVRKGKSILDWICIVWDPIMAALIVVNPILYATLGRSTSVASLSPIAALSGLFTLFRVWFNLGPNIYTKLGGIGFFILAICGAAMLAVYQAVDAEWIHALIGGSFIASTIPLSIAFLHVSEEETSGGQEEENKKNLPASDEEEAVVLDA